MGQFLTILVILAILVVAPLKAAAAILGTVLLSTLVVQTTTSTFSKVNVTLIESFKAIVLSLFFSAVAVFTTISFMRGAPREFLNNLSGMALVAMQYSAYVLGFRIALGLTFFHAAVVAIASTIITSACLWFIGKMVALA